MELDIIHNKEENRFETYIEEQTALVEYTLDENKLLVITHTYVPKSLEGKGIAGTITKFVLEYAREHKLAVRPLCPYTAAYLQRHPEYSDLLKTE